MLMVRLKYYIYLIILFRVFQSNILQKYQTKPKDFHVFFQYLAGVQLRPDQANWIKYSRIDQVKFVEDNL